MRTVGTGILILLTAASSGRGQEGTVTPSSMGSSVEPKVEDSKDVKHPVDPEEEEKRQRRFEEAIAGLGTAAEAVELNHHLHVLGDDFGEARPLLVKAATHGTPRVRALTLKLFGDHGNVDDDLDLVVRALDDQSTTVRMAAVAAVRRLGKEGTPALLRRLALEREPGIRKVAVRALKMWEDPDAVPPLARLLTSENHPGVRKHIVRALEELSGKRYGDDTEAWLAYAEDYLYKKNEKRILEYSRSLPEQPRNTRRKRRK